MPDSIDERLMAERMAEYATLPVTFVAGPEPWLADLGENFGQFFFTEHPGTKVHIPALYLVRPKRSILCDARCSYWDGLRRQGNPRMMRVLARAHH